MNTRKLNKFCHFHCDQYHDIKKCHALKKKENERLIIRGYLHQFMKKEIRSKHERKEVCILDDLFEIK